MTHKKELTAIFKRLWKFKGDQPHRDLHLDLLSAELKELRDTLQCSKRLGDNRASGYAEMSR